MYVTPPHRHIKLSFGRRDTTLPTRLVWECTNQLASQSRINCTKKFEALRLNRKHFREYRPIAKPNLGGKTMSNEDITNTISTEVTVKWLSNGGTFQAKWNMYLWKTVLPKEIITSRNSNHLKQTVSWKNQSNSCNTSWIGRILRRL